MVSDILCSGITSREKAVTTVTEWDKHIRVILLHPNYPLLPMDR